MGVRLLSNPATELLICVCAKENKNAGMPLPVSPTATNLGHCDQSVSLRCQYTIGAKAKEEIPNLRQASCTGSNASKDFLIKINEHPHTKLNMIKMTQEMFSIGFLSIFKYKLQSNEVVT